MKPIWIVDDDESIRWVLEKALARENLPTRSFSNARDAMDALQTMTPQVLVSDIRMPGESGLALLQAAKARYPGLPVIIMTAFSDLDSAVAAFQGGAFEYLAKPFDLDKAVELIRRALEESLRETNQEQAATDTPEILGQAPAMQDVFRAIGRLSQSNVTVLITGESGTGKELVARALHKHSPRSAQPFIALNTAAIPKDLLESELFGHERGAFTGAQAMRRGRFEQAEGGTLFLDEIGVIAATHQNLETRVKEGLFREDLYHRLNVIRLRLPSLRERREDIPLLTRHFLAQSARELGVEAKRMSDSAMQFLASLDLPGNVRQLENLCNWITVMAPGQTVEIKDLPPEMLQVRQSEAAPVIPTPAPQFVPPRMAETPNGNGGSYVGNAGSGAIAAAVIDGGRSDGANAGAPARTGNIEHPNWIALLESEAAQMLAAGRPEVMDALGRQFESALIKTALRHTHGRKNDAAVRLGIGRNTITRKIHELGIDGAKDE
jgi:two-component system nitrogen regulation response regulator GlnG